MGFLEKLFKKKEKDKKEKKKEVNLSNNYRRKIRHSNNGLPLCMECGLEIDKELQGQKTFDGYKFHKKCFRKEWKRQKAKQFN